jgi:cystathionine beta-lyase
MMYDFDTIIERRNTDSAKWRKYKSADILPMWVADMDFPSPPVVIEALHRRIEHGIFGYGTYRRSFRDAVVSYLDRSFNWKVDPKWIIWLPGLVVGLNIACRSVGQKGDGVLTAVPIYPPFLSAPGLSQRALKTTRLVHNHDMEWRLDFDHIAASCDERMGLFLLCHPHNPTGRVLTPKELTRLADICMRNNMVICSDEIHCDLVLDENCRHIPFAALSPEIERQTITLMAPSKTYNIPGLYCSYAVVPDDTLRRRFKQTMAGIVPHVNILGMVAAQAAYDHGQPWLDALIPYLKENRDLVSQTINSISGLKMGPVEATYLAWIDVSRLNHPHPIRFFEGAGVGLSRGKDFNGDGFVRMNFGCPRTLLRQALDRMSAAVQHHMDRYRADSA